METVSYRVEITKKEVNDKILVEIPKFKLSFTVKNESEIERFIEYSCDLLSEGSKFILSFRDYSEKRVGDNRFIPVKSDANRILTCFLDYTPTHVVVTDLLHEFNGKTWEQKVSSYKKFRMSGDEVIDLLEENNMSISYREELNGLITIMAKK